MEKPIYIIGEKTRYTIDGDSKVWSYKFGKMYKKEIAIDKTFKIFHKGKNYRLSVSKLINEIPSFNKLINDMPYSVWYDVPKDNFNECWNIIESNYFKNTPYFLETDPSDQQFRKVKRI